MRIKKLRFVIDEHEIQKMALENLRRILPSYIVASDIHICGDVVIISGNIEIPVIGRKKFDFVARVETDFAGRYLYLTVKKIDIPFVPSWLAIYILGDKLNELAAKKKGLFYSTDRRRLGLAFDDFLSIYGVRFDARLQKFDTSYGYSFDFA